MEQRDLVEAYVQTKRMGNLLTEVLDLSRQLAEVLDRNDQVSIGMLIAMRAEPIAALKQTDESLKEQASSLPSPQDQQRLTGLLHGDEAANEAEKPLAEQVAANRRLLVQVRELDQVLNRKLAGEQSVYEQR